MNADKRSILMKTFFKQSQAGCSTVVQLIINLASCMSGFYVLCAVALSLPLNLHYKKMDLPQCTSDISKYLHQRCLQYQKTYCSLLMIELFQQRKIHSDLENLPVSDLSISGVRKCFLWIRGYIVPRPNHI